MNESQLTIGQLLSALNRNKTKCALVFLLTIAAVVAYWMFAPRKYGSEGRIFVQLGRANTGIEYVDGAMPVSIQTARENEVRSVMELIKSYDVIAKAVQDPEVTLDAVLKSPFDFIFNSINLPKSRGESSSDSSGGMSHTEREKLVDLQKAVKAVSQSMNVSMEKNTSVISVYVSANDPMLAKKIVDRIMHYTAEAHVNVHQRTGTVLFYENEYQDGKKKVRDAEIALKEFRNGIREVSKDGEIVKEQIGKPFLSVQGARSTMQQIIDKLENQLLDLELDHRQAQEEVAKLTEEMNAVGKLVEVPTKGVERLSTESAQEEIFRLKSERAELTSKYRSHPRIDIINSRLAELERAFENLPSDRTEMMSVSNPAFEELSVEKSKAFARQNAVKARLDLATKKYESAVNELKAFNLTEIQAEVLKRNLAVELDYLNTVIDKRGDVALINRLDELKVSDVVVQQEGSLLPKHASPKGSILLPMGLVLATLLSFLTAIVFDRTQLLSNDVEEVEEVLDLPVLITLPRVANRRSMVR